MCRGNREQSGDPLGGSDVFYNETPTNAAEKDTK